MLPNRKETLLKITELEKELAKITPWGRRPSLEQKERMLYLEGKISFHQNRLMSPRLLGEIGLGYEAMMKRD